MKLQDAPTIIKRFGLGDEWLGEAAARLRRLHADPPTENRQGQDQTDCALKQLAEDIWSINGRLGIHTDKTRRGFQVIGLVIINEPGLRLVTHDGIFPIPVGTVYHIDGRSPHAALEPRMVRLDADGMAATEPELTTLFGFMAWDVRRSTDVGELLDSIPDSMQAFANGENRINVAV